MIGRLNLMANTKYEKAKDTHGKNGQCGEPTFYR